MLELVLVSLVVKMPDSIVHPKSASQVMFDTWIFSTSVSVLRSSSFWRVVASGVTVAVGIVSLRLHSPQVNHYLWLHCTFLSYMLLLSALHKNRCIGRDVCHRGCTKANAHTVLGVASFASPITNHGSTICGQRTESFACNGRFR